MKRKQKNIIGVFVAVLATALLVGGLSALTKGFRVWSSPTSDKSITTASSEKKIESIKTKVFLEQSTTENDLGKNYELELHETTDHKWFYYDDYTVDYGRAYRVRVEKTIKYNDNTTDLSTTFSNKFFEWCNSGTASFYYYVGTDLDNDLTTLINGEEFKILQRFKGDLFFIDLNKTLEEE